MNRLMHQDALEIIQITNADTLRKMLSQCEDEIMRLAKEAEGIHYWPSEVEELVRDELGTRACILNHMFALHSLGDGSTILFLKKCAGIRKYSYLCSEFTEQVNHGKKCV